MRTPHQSVDRLGSRPVEPAVNPSAPGSLPLSGSVDDGDRLVDVVDLLALDAFVTGREPFGGPLTVRVGEAEHHLGRQLASAMRVAS